MNRLTSKNAEGAIEIAEAYQSAALRKLAAYEDMHEALELQYEDVVARLERMKAEGNMKGATGNQLLAQKMALGATLRMFEAYGVQ